MAPIYLHHWPRFWWVTHPSQRQSTITLGFLLYFTKYVFMCHYLSIFIHRWRYKSTNLLWHWQWFTLRKLHYTNSTPQQALLYKFITIWADLSYQILNHHLIHREKCSFMFSFTWQWLLVSFPDSFEWSLKARYGKREVLFCMWLDPTAILEKIDVNSLLNHNVSIWC